MNCRWRVVWVLACLAVPVVATGAGFDQDDDGDIDLADFEGFADCLAGPAVMAAPGCEGFDDNGDLYVDLFDFWAFQSAFGPGAPADFIRTELAGNALAEYPYFEYVKAFNEDATVDVAIDPTRFPEIAGQTCDIYVTDAKSGAAWTVDPTLTDVVGGPQEVTFTGTNVQDNTYEVSGPFDLNADAGLGLGVGYDVVLDCDQNGLLSGGDYIDGFSAEAGLYAIHDTTQSGPLAVTEVIYSGGSWLGQDTYYPTDIASLGQLPLIVVSHGNGHNYQWYDHIGFHMASYGYIVMSHQNETGPGIETASNTTLNNTDYLLANQDWIADGALAGHIDSSRITWIGHSRGAEGVARAYDKLFDGTHSATHYTLDDIRLISSMLPTDFLGTNSSNPHDANYHLWTASGDSDVDGSAGCEICQTFHLHDRATHYRQSTVVQGTGHGWFHAGGGSAWFSGPCSIGEAGTHAVQLGYFLPLIKYYIEGNIPAHDFLWRQYETFHPIGVDTSDPCFVVTNMHRNGNEDGNVMIDDYQTNESPGTSSSGGSVNYTVENVTEDRLNDNNSSFSWTSSDPMNGMTLANNSGDTSRGVVFDWNGTDRYYEWEIISSLRNFSDKKYLSFRGAQGTQHPYTLAFMGDTTFSVTLEDGSGTTSSINIGAYGGGLEQPYARSGGWHNEMETVRIRITDFLANGSGLDLTDIETVRFDFGPSWGSSQGRIGIDELMLTNDHPPYASMSMSLPGGAPEFLPPGQATVIDVEILTEGESVVPGSATMYYRYTGGAFQSVPLQLIGGGLYQGTLPAPQCGDTPEFYFSAEGAVLGTIYDPPGGSVAPYVAFVGSFIGVLDDNFETDMGWTVESIDLTDGEWERGIPAGGGLREDPPTDFDGSGHCYLTDNVPGNSDVDGGPTMLMSPMFDLSATSNPVLQYARWWHNDDDDGDPLDVWVSDDDGATWTLIETALDTPEWVEKTVYFTDYGVDLTSQMRIRFDATDNPSNSIDEGGIDAVRIFEVLCVD